MELLESFTGMRWEVGIHLGSTAGHHAHTFIPRVNLKSAIHRLESFWEVTGNPHRHFENIWNSTHSVTQAWGQTKDPGVEMAILPMKKKKRNNDYTCAAKTDILLNWFPDIFLSLSYTFTYYIGNFASVYKKCLQLAKLESKTDILLRKTTRNRFNNLIFGLW